MNSQEFRTKLCALISDFMKDGSSSDELDAVSAELADWSEEIGLLAEAHSNAEEE